MADIDRLLTFLKENDCSDLHLVAGLEPRVRQKGKIQLIPDEGILSDAELRRLMREIASARGWEEYAGCNDLDFAYGLEGVARFRANYFVQDNGAAAVFRIIPEEARQEADGKWRLKKQVEKRASEKGQQGAASDSSEQRDESDLIKGMLGVSLFVNAIKIFKVFPLTPVGLF